MLELRAATLGDAGELAALHSDSWRAAYPGILPQSYLDRLGGPRLVGWWRRRLVAADDRHDVTLATEAGRAVGFAQIGPCFDDDSLAGFAGEVKMLYVAPGETGRGVGGALLAHVEQVLAARGYFWLVIWVLERNDGAQRFYARHGLRPDGAQRRDRFSGRTVPVIRCAKPLNPVRLEY